MTFSLALSDVDNDGYSDIVVGNMSQANQLYLNTGAGSFSQSYSLKDDNSRTQSVALADMNGNGYLDLVAGNIDKNQVCFNSTSNTFLKLCTEKMHDIHTPSIALGDIDGDNSIDILTANWITTNRAYENNFSITGSEFGGLRDYSWAAALADVNGDGTLDAIIANALGRANRIYLNNGENKGFKYSTQGKP